MPMQSPTHQKPPHHKHIKTKGHRITNFGTRSKMFLRSAAIVFSGFYFFRKRENFNVVWKIREIIADIFSNFGNFEIFRMPEEFIYIGTTFFQNLLLNLFVYQQI